MSFLLPYSMLWNPPNEAVNLFVPLNTGCETSRVLHKNLQPNIPNPSPELLFSTEKKIMFGEIYYQVPAQLVTLLVDL
jgi:hypothetical protein